jgi:hypothetical protein
VQARLVVVVVVMLVMAAAAVSSTNIVTFCVAELAAEDVPLV